MVFNAYVADHEDGHHDVIDGVDYALPDCPLCPGTADPEQAFREMHPEDANRARRDPSQVEVR